MTPEEIKSFKDMIECLKRANEEIENLKLGNYIKEKYDDEVLLKIFNERNRYKQVIKDMIEFINDDHNYFEDGENWENVLHIRNTLEEALGDKDD